MLVYGDRPRLEDPERRARRIRRALARRKRDGSSTASAAEALLLDAGELACALLDSDETSPAARAAEALLRSLARAIYGAGVWSETRAAARRLAAALRGTRGLLPMRAPEGFAHYAVYPELYAEAARRWRAANAGPLHVFGIRSIGAVLGAVVWAAAGGDGAFTTVRPEGHPFERRLVLSRRAVRRLRRAVDRARFAIVDEGPGLSGSSFAAVAGALADAGIPGSRVHFFPSHPGAPGPRAAAARKSWWSHTDRTHVSFEECLLDGDPSRLERAVSDVTGRWESAPEDLGGGRWRARIFARRADWPPVDIRQERRKYLVRASGGPWLLKFAGLGRYGDAKRALAARLARRGLSPAVRMRDGFLVALWRNDTPFSACGQADRSALVDFVARYLAFRAGLGPAARPGASPAALFEMLRYNLAAAGGRELAAEAERWRRRLDSLGARAAPVLSDNRMHAWEWLVAEDGRIWKADAVDHHDGHDLVGPQDPAWDFAGALVELALSRSEEEDLRRGIARRGVVPPHAETTAFYRLAYLGFEIGRLSLGAAALASDDPEESARLEDAAASRLEAARAALGGELRAAV